MMEKRLRNGYGKHKKSITICIREGMPVALISLGKRKVTKISLSDIDILTEYSFYAHQRSDGQYVARASQKDSYDTRPYLHRLILDAEFELEVDHVNGVPLDNTRGNLREATTVQNNLAKKSELVFGFSGIEQVQEFSIEYKPHPRGGSQVVLKPHKFMAIGPDGKRFGPYIGRDKDFPEEAAEAAAIKRDELMLEEYWNHYGDYEHHNYGFIDWNGDTPKEAHWMAHYLEDERGSAIELGTEKLREMYPNVVF